MANFSLLRGAGQEISPRAVPIGDTAGLNIQAASLLRQSLGGQQQGPRRAVAVRAAEKEPTVEEKQLALDKSRAELEQIESQTGVLNAQAALADAARKGNVGEYQKALQQVSPQQAHAFQTFNKGLAKAFLQKPGVAQAVGFRPKSGPGSTKPKPGPNPAARS